MSKWAHGGRTEQYKASVHRKVDAEKLRDAHRWRGAMYLLGYAVECNLKAKLMERYRHLHLQELQTYLRRRFRPDVDVFTHSLHDLMTWTENEARITDSLRQAWGQVSKWQVDWRYSPEAGTERECGDFFRATECVLGFIQRSV
jgi:hypothetical protein